MSSGLVPWGLSIPPSENVLKIKQQNLTNWKNKEIQFKYAYRKLNTEGLVLSTKTQHKFN